MTRARDGRIGLAALALTYGVVFGTALVGGIRALLGHPTGPAFVTWGDRVAALEGDAFYVIVVVVVLRWLRATAPEYARHLQLRMPSARSLVAGAAGYVAVATACGWVGARITSAMHWSTGPSVLSDRGVDALVTGLGASVAAAFAEELVLVAMTAAVVETVLGARSSRRVVISATLAATLALRWSVHLYYLGGSVFVLAWAPAAYLLYRWVRSVWPLVLGHACYDAVLVVAHAWPATAVALDRMLWALAAVGGAFAAGLLVRAVRVRTSVVASPNS